MHSVELLAPAKNIEELKLFMNKGADAVYIDYMNNTISWDELVNSVEFAHSIGKKVYIAINVVPHNSHFKEIEDYLKKLEIIKIDAIIITDPGMLSIAKNIIPNMEIHLSDQANITNYVSAKFWHEEGIKRVLLSKELSCDEIGGVRVNTPIDMDIEIFVHGAMGISHSGRPLLSNFISDKSNNNSLLEKLNNKRYNLVEEKRQGEYFPVYEDERGTFFFNSEELCMLEHIPTLIKSGVTSFKIEGRMKDSDYIGEVVKAYRIAIDEFYKNPNEWKFNPQWMESLKELNSREYTPGFYLENPNQDCSEK
ncbi:peptidase U32 family protein [Romboutsia sp.]|uniref:peptidase U32 family protein n=1 Tax=Romboutsia sp. TaxID=1965302 RepID=UPI003F2F7358